MDMDCGPPDDAATGSRYGLDSLFYPGTIVVIETSTVDSGIARSVWQNLVSTFPNDKVKRVVINAEAPDYSALPCDYDLAIIIAEGCYHNDIAQACDNRRIKTGAFITPDYRENELLNRDVLANSEPQFPNGFRYLGPQSYGFILPYHNVNATSLPLTTPKPGGIAFLSQSGAMCAAVLDWSKRTSTGFSAVVSCGHMHDIDWHDLITYFGDDPRSKSIVIYLENIPDTRSFFSAAREIALSKPIIVLKAGRTGVVSAAVNSRTFGGGQSDALLNAAFQRVGVLRVKTIAELFYMANILSTQPLPRGPKLAIVTNALGPAIMASDFLLESGGQLAEFSHELSEKLAQRLPEQNVVSNPLDLMGDATSVRYSDAILELVKDSTVDGLLVVLAPQYVNDPKDTARALIAATRKYGKPVLASWMGKDRVLEGHNILYDAGIPAFPYPDTPARLFALMWRQTQNLDAVYETPAIISNESEMAPDVSSVSIMLEGIREEGRSELNEWEAIAVLSAYGIPVVQTLPAFTEEEAVTCAAITGYPVALKLLSPSYHLKRAVHGVRLNLRQEQDVIDGFRSIEDSVAQHGTDSSFAGVTVQKMAPRKGIDLVIGTGVDAHFGPYIYFGSGGATQDTLLDHAIGLPPLTTALAQRMIERTRAWQQLQMGSRISQATLHQLQSILVRTAQLITQNPIIREMEINPLLCTSDSVLALDARISVYPSSVTVAQLPRPTIRPYPVQYTWKALLKDKTPIVIRPVRPEDEPLIVEFHKKLSEDTIYRRYFFQHKLTRRTSHERLRRTCFLDFDREVALAAAGSDPIVGTVIMGVGRLARKRKEDEAEIAIVIADPYQGKGLGTKILGRLIDTARAEHIHKLEGTMLPGNIHMQHLFTRAGFTVKTNLSDVVVAELYLS